MANILDYLDWRGDLTLQERPFNEVDNLILAELSFLDLQGIVPSAFSAPVAITEAVEHFEQNHPSDHMGVLVPNQIPELARRVMCCGRFSQMTLCGYRTALDDSKETQFAAVTFLLPDHTAYVAFRGTDDTIVGWKEDFNLSFLPQVPAQKLAADYLAEAAAGFPNRPIRVGGHSKGGNLAMYSALSCAEAVQNQVCNIYNNDGPGFQTSVLGTPEHQRIKEKICTIVPESSIVGMLLEHEETYQVVRAKQVGLRQHDGFSWQVKGDSFAHLPELNGEGRRTDHALRSFIKAMSPEQRMTFTEALFEILGCTEAQTLTELKEGGLKTAAAMLKKYSKMERETKQALGQTLGLLIKSGAQSAADDLNPIQHIQNHTLLQKIACELEQQLMADRQKGHDT